MLSANEAAATLAKQEQIPFVYRIHENPPKPDRNACLRRCGLGLNARGIQHGIRPGAHGANFRGRKGDAGLSIVNMQVLAPRQKRKYSEIRWGITALLWRIMRILLRRSDVIRI